MKLSVLIGAALCLATASPSVAQTINGDANLRGAVRGGAVVAIGDGASAEIAAGSIVGRPQVDGDVTLSAQTGWLTAVALGVDNRAAIYIGSLVGGDVNGDVTARGSARSVTVVSLVPGDTSCVAIGSVRGIGQGSTSVVAHVGNVVVVDFIPWVKSRVNIGTSGRPC